MTQCTYTSYRWNFLLRLAITNDFIFEKLRVFNNKPIESCDRWFVWVFSFHSLQYSYEHKRYPQCSNFNFLVNCGWKTSWHANLDVHIHCALLEVPLSSRSFHNSVAILGKKNCFAFFAFERLIRKSCVFLVSWFFFFFSIWERRVSATAIEGCSSSCYEKTTCHFWTWVISNRSVPISPLFNSFWGIEAEVKNAILRILCLICLGLGSWKNFVCL